MNVIIKNQDQIIIRPMIDIIASYAIDFKNEILALIHDVYNKRYIMDLFYVNEIDSIGFGIISSIYQRLNVCGNYFEVVNVNDNVWNLFCTMRLNRSFNVYKYSKS